MSEGIELGLKVMAPAVGLILAIVKFVSSKKNKQKETDKIEINNVINNEVSLQGNENKVSKDRQKVKIKFNNLDEAKLRAKILFIDDDKQYKHYRILRNNGWNNSSMISDLPSIDSDQARSADIFFVDIHGVGKKMAFQDEGLGLARALMDRYPEKYVVIYSSESNGNRFNETLLKADYALSKYADVYEFEKCLSRFLVESV